MKGWLTGPHTLDELELMFGKGRTAAILRFVVVQPDKLRLCDDARALYARGLLPATVPLPTALSNLALVTAVHDELAGCPGDGSFVVFPT